ncbi:MAG: cation:proton antiporter subunit C [Lentisphaeria bacterium]|nr:cation:proton antiporter subunit C [Lentisphaeria bacterium]
MEAIRQILQGSFNYWIYVILMMIGLFAMIGKRNLVKKLIGMTIFQTAIILFYVSIGVKKDSTIPILKSDDMPGHHATDLTEAEKIKNANHKINPNHYANPLPHVLMLTAIVVGVATLGVGLALTQKIYRQYGSIEEDEILKRIQELESIDDFDEIDEFDDKALEQGEME